jgi:hypothetical protein
MDEVHPLRDAYNADVCVLIITSIEYCGLASAILASASNAFCAVSWDCATGYYSFSHEIGHLQGCRHNLEADPTLTPFQYGHGYLYAAGAWRTVMSYNSTSCNGGYCDRIQHFSNPDVVHNSLPTGTAQYEDCARVIDETASIVAGFNAADSGFSFRINNEGVENLVIDSITNDQNWLTTSGYTSVPINITGNSSKKIYVNIGWWQLGTTTQTDTIKIYSNDDDEPLVEVVVKVHPQPVSEDLVLQNDTVFTGQVTCFDALDVITLGGNGSTFIVQNGAQADFIAGGSVLLKSGVHLQSGAEVHAYITTSSQYCGMTPGDILLATGVQPFENVIVKPDDGFLMVYPNPTYSKINIEMRAQQNKQTVDLQVYDFSGRLISEIKQWNGNSIEIDLKDYNSGIYIIKAIQGTCMDIRKIVLL